MRKYQQQLQVTIGLMPYYLWSQVNFTPFYVGFNIDLQSWLIVFLSHQRPSLVNLEMATQWVVIVSADHFDSDNLKQVRKAFSVYYSINFIPAIFQAFFPDLASRLIYRLQLT